MHPKVELIQGLACVGHVEEAEDPLMRKILRLYKLFDELARGKAMAQLLRG